MIENFYTLFEEERKVLKAGEFADLIIEFPPTLKRNQLLFSDLASKPLAIILSPA